MLPRGNGFIEARRAKSKEKTPPKRGVGQIIRETSKDAQPTNAAHVSRRPVSINAALYRRYIGPPSARALRYLILTGRYRTRKRGRPVDLPAP
jgi:hypothetical protein